MSKLRAFLASLLVPYSSARAFLSSPLCNRQVPSQRFLKFLDEKEIVKNCVSRKGAKAAEFEEKKNFLCVLSVLAR